MKNSLKLEEKRCRSRVDLHIKSFFNNITMSTITVFALKILDNSMQRRFYKTKLKVERLD